MELHTLQNSSRAFKRRRRVGRGVGSGLGKTCGRGVKGAGSRSGWKQRARYEGGQIPLYRKLPTRGFCNTRFQRRFDCINLDRIDQLFSDGAVVNVTSLYEVGFLKGDTYGVKVLANGELTKKVRLEVQALSKQAEQKLKAAGIEYSVVE